MNLNAAKRDAPRPYRPADEEAASAVLGDIRPLGDPACHTLVVGESVISGSAVWLEPAIGGEPYLGPVIVAEGRPGRELYELVLACAEDALAHGHDRGYFTVKDPGLIRLLRLTFSIDPVATGWEPEGGQPREWEVHVELRDAIEQLHGIIAMLGGRAN